MSIQIKRSTLAEKLIYLEGKPFGLDEYAPFRKVYDCQDNVIVLMTGRQTGKSTSIANFLLTEGVSIPQFRSLFVSPSKEQTSRFSNTRFAKSLFFSPMLKKYFVSNNVAANNVTLRMLTNGSEFYFSYAQDDADRIRGISADRLCVTGDTKLYLENGTTVTVDSIVGNRMIGARVLTLNESTLKLEPKPIEKIFITGIKEVFEVTTDSGRRIKATADHPILTRDGWRQISDLRIGDWLAEPTELPVVDIENNEEDLPEALLQVCGYLLGDGRHEKFSRVGFSNTDPKVISHFVECLRALDAEFTTRSYVKETPLGGELTEHIVDIYGSKGSNKKGLKAELHDLGIIGQDCYSKRIPFLNRLVNKKSIVAFLSTLYASDGCICISNSKSGNKEYLISYTSTSRDLSEEVQLLLLRLGINSVLRIRKPENGVSKKTQHIVQIRNHRNAQAFLDCITIVGKEDKCEELRSILKSREGNKWQDSDTLPFGDYFRGLLKDHGVTLSSLRKRGCYPASNGDICRNKILKIAEITGIPEFKRLAESPLAWEKVRSITPLPKELVYDLSIKDNHNFVANGLIAHNCIDEVQSIVLEAVEPVIRECLAASKYKFRMYCGTPLSSENDIEVMLWQKSTQNEWVVQCKECGAHNILGIKNIGPKFIMCARCEKQIDVRNGVWFVTNRAGNFPGFRIPQISLHRNVGTPEAYKAILEKQRDYSKAQFNNEVLGVSDSLGARLVSLDMIKALCKDYFWMEDAVNPETMRGVTSVVAGVDWSGQSPQNVSRTCIAIWGILHDGRLRLLYGKIFPTGHAVQDLQHIAKLCQLYGVRIVIGDSGEGMLANAELRQKLGSHVVYGNRYGGGNMGKIKWNNNSNDPGYQSDKTLIIDQVMHCILARQFEFPHWQQFKEFTDDIMAAYEETTTQGRRVWKHAATRPDDFLQSMAYGWLAAKVATGQVVMYSDPLPADSHEF